MFARVLLGCAALGVLAFAALADEPKGKDKPFKPTFVFSGSHSAIDRETFAVVADEVAWKVLWVKHRGKLFDPQFTEHQQDVEIDFNTHYVVAIFSAQWDWCQVTPRKRGDEVVIGFRPIGYSTEGRLPGTKDTRTEHEKAKEAAIAPYAFVVLPKPVQTVVIEKDVREHKSDPPLWKERARFPAPKDKK